jgi:hypothetical protein
MCPHISFHWIKRLVSYLGGVLSNTLRFSVCAPSSPGMTRKLSVAISSIRQILGLNTSGTELRVRDDRIGKINTKLMRLACARTMPKPSQDYFEFIAHKDRRMRFYSRWIGWDKRGQEVRVPSLMNASYRVPNLRGRLDAPVYVIETRAQLLAWRHMAYVVQELAERELRPAFDRVRDVVPDIREEFIDLEEDYTHNYATWYPSGK